MPRGGINATTSPTWFAAFPVPTTPPTPAPTAPTVPPTSAPSPTPAPFSMPTIEGVKAASSTYLLSVTGCTGGGIWGTDIYTDDSTKCLAAVHMGLVTVGQTKTLRFYVLPGMSSYTGTTRNGVTTSSYGGWAASYTIAL